MATIPIWDLRLPAGGLLKTVSPQANSFSNSFLTKHLRFESLPVSARARCASAVAFAVVYGTPLA